MQDVVTGWLFCLHRMGGSLGRVTPLNFSVAVPGGESLLGSTFLGVKTSGILKTIQNPFMKKIVCGLFASLINYHVKILWLFLTFLIFQSSQAYLLQLRLLASVPTPIHQHCLEPYIVYTTIPAQNKTLHMCRWQLWHHWNHYQVGVMSSFRNDTLQAMSTWLQKYLSHPSHMHILSQIRGLL